MIAALALKLLPIRAALAKVPRWAWIALAVALVLLITWRWHVSQVRDSRAAGYGQAMSEVKVKSDRIVKAANAATAKATNLAVVINREERARADDQNRATATAAADLRRLRPVQPLHCRATSAPAVPRAPGGRKTPRGEPDAALVAVDWAWLIDRAEQADLNRTETLAWRAWHERQTATYEQWRTEWNKIGGNNADTAVKR